MHIFIFRRDLRVVDNLALQDLYQLHRNAGIVPVFIFNPKQVEPAKNEYFSHASVQFMVECLDGLLAACNKKLVLLYGEDVDVLDHLHKTKGIQTVAFNKDCTPFAIHRDTAIESWCKSQGIAVLTRTDDYHLIDPRAMDKPYQVFTPFYKRYLKTNKVPEPLERAPPVQWESIHSSSMGKYKYSLKRARQLYTRSDTLLCAGGRDKGLAILHTIRNGMFAKYDKTRNTPATHGTTRMSPYLKFGSISIREAYHAVKDAHSIHHGLIRELYWRAFYDQIAFHFPQVLDGQLGKGHKNKALRPRYDDIKWGANTKLLDAWKKGKTGFPIVDAGMRQLNASGWMHNRVRMIVSSFLVKDMHVDWREGEKYFATKLIDLYHPSNNGGWQWCTGSGADAQQYTRIFNPWLQGERYDPECEYIKAWVPELAGVNRAQIHAWHDAVPALAKSTGYPVPILIHKDQVKKTKALYYKALRS